MYEMLKHAHSGTRWLLLIGVIITLVLAISKWTSNKGLDRTNLKIGLLTMIFAHVQLLLGLALYFQSPKVQLENMGETMKNAMLRFFAVEHMIMMILAIILITISHSLCKRRLGTVKGSRIVSILMILTLILFFIGIPWPPKYGAGWF